jgi:hypothetical protein
MYPPPAPPPMHLPQAPPGFAPPAVSMPVPGGPIPPNMHWAVVLVLSWITFGLGAVIWMFRQAAFVKRLDPGSRAVALLVASVLAMACQAWLVFVKFRSLSAGEAAAALSGFVVLNLLIVALSLVAVFAMRRSIVRYYNSVEPIHLKLSGLMTFFFSILYFQYHFSRIAGWKKTGRLP